MTLLQACCFEKYLILKLLLKLGKATYRLFSIVHYSLKMYKATTNVSLRINVKWCIIKRNLINKKGQQLMNFTDLPTDKVLHITPEDKVYPTRK